MKRSDWALLRAESQQPQISNLQVTKVLMAYSSPYSCSVDTSTGKIGAGKNSSDYTEFTLCFPTIKFPGSYAFTVVMWNGVSE